MNVEKLIKKPSRICVDYYATVDGQTTNDAIDYAVEEIARRCNIAYKEGEDAESVLRDSLGDKQFDAALQQTVISRLTPFIIKDEADLNMALEPQCTSDEIPRRDESFSFKIHVLLKPTCILSSYDPVEVTVSRYTISDELVKKRFEDLVKHDHEFAQAADDPQKTEELCTQVKAELEKEAQEKTDQELSLLVDIMLANRLQCKIPPELFEAGSNSVYMNLRQKIESQGLSLEKLIQDGSIDIEKFRNQIIMEGQTIICQGLALGKLFEMKIGRLEEEDYKRAYRAFSPENPDEVKREFEENGRLYAIEEVAKRLAAHKWLLETAEITYKDTEYVLEPKS